jgi:hypothetical protein
MSNGRSRLSESGGTRTAGWDLMHSSGPSPMYPSPKLVVKAESMALLTSVVNAWTSEPRERNLRLSKAAEHSKNRPKSRGDA